MLRRFLTTLGLLAALLTAAPSLAQSELDAAVFRTAPASQPKRELAQLAVTPSFAAIYGRSTAAAPTGPTTYVASSPNVATTSTCPSSCSGGNLGTGFATGDLLVVLANAVNNTATFMTASVPSGAMTDMSSGATQTCVFNYKLYYKTLNATTDANAAVSFSNMPNNGSMLWYIVHGPTSAALRNHQCGSAAATSLTLTGFTSAGNTAGALVIAENKIDNVTPTSVTNFTMRVNNGVDQTYWVYSVADWFGYASSGNVSLSPFGATSSPQPQGFLLELLR